MALLDWFKKLRSNTSDDKKEATPQDHPKVDWTKWASAKGGEVRSPCPALNALANHGVLPRNGKGITKAMAVEAITEAFNLDKTIASTFAAGGIAANPDHKAQSFDLDHLQKHGVIEHDVSLSRQDAALGSNTNFSKEVFDKALQGYHTHAAASGTEGLAMTDWSSACRIRYARVLACKEAHERAGKKLEYGLKEAILSYGETALYLSLLGKEGKAPVEWFRILFEEERLPYEAGWRAPAKIDQSMMNHAYLEMLKVHEDPGEEARMIGIGTVEALKTAVLSLGFHHMKTPNPN